MSARPKTRRRQSMATGKQAASRKKAAYERQAIIELLSEHESMTGKELCAKLGMEAQHLRGKLSWMMAQGEVRSELVQGENAPFIAIYSLGVQDSRKEISQRIVSKWKHEPVKHEPLLAAFFGINNNEGMI